MSDLELLLEVESQQKNEALAKVEALGERVRELENHEASERTLSSEQRAEELEEQLQAEAQQKRKAAEKAELLELRLAELERRLSEQSQGPDGAEKQVKGILWDPSVSCLGSALTFTACVADEKRVCRDHPAV